MPHIKESVTVDVPVSVAYNQWTQFEEFPHFMDGIAAVEQLDDAHVVWTAEVGREREQWVAEITHQEPDKRITWRTTSGRGVNGDIQFAPEGATRTTIDVELEFDAAGFLERLGGRAVVDWKVNADLNRFKELIERPGHASGGWRGEILGGDVVRDDDASLTNG